MATIHQTETFEGTAEAIFNALMTSEGHAALTGESADITPEIGASFTTYGDYATGKNLEIIQNKKIFQTWRAADWPEGIESTITIELNQLEPLKTVLDFTQEEVPEEEKDSIEAGWHEWYWQPMHAYLKNVSPVQ